MDYSGKHVLITGGTSGIGFAFDDVEAITGACLSIDFGLTAGY